MKGKETSVEESHTFVLTLQKMAIQILDHHLLVFKIPLVLVYACIFPQIRASSSYSGKSSCPLDFDYVSNISWDSSSCRNIIEVSSEGHDGSTSNCCQTLTSLYGVAFAQHLNKTSVFRLPNLDTSVSCLSAFRERLSSLGLSGNLVSSCFRPQQFVNTTNVCANIQTREDWISILGSSTALDTRCKQDLSDLTACDACLIAGFEVQARLLAVDGNRSRSRGCFYYTILYAAGMVNQFGPTSDGSLSCIFGLPLSLERTSKGSDKWVLEVCAVGGGFLVLAATCFIGGWLSLYGRRQQGNLSDIFSILDQDLDENALLNWRPKGDTLWFDIHDLQKATDGFSSKNFIGNGRFGTVCRGKLPDGTVIAVKKVMESEFVGDSEFYTEVEMISTLKHRNLVPLRGCCMSSGVGEIERYLVYDYMPNGNLNDHLFLAPKGRNKAGKKPLTWPQRKRIILDVANALAYLHYGVKPPIYHRDIKPTNILLDSCMRARVADFGLAKQGTEGESHFTTRIAGTHGYLAPEYAIYGQLTAKSDVYSFGIVVLEIMSGRKPLDLSGPASLITDWAWPLVKNGKLEQVLDPSLLGEDDERGGEYRCSMMIIERFVRVGILCAHLMVALRPTMSDALKILEGDMEVPVIPDRPSYAGGDMFTASSKAGGEHNWTCELSG